MFTKQMEKLADVLIEKEISKSEDKDILVYGFTTGVELIFNIITTIALGLLFGLILESFVFLISFSFIRTYAGGYHCQKAINCYLMSSGIVGLALAIVRFAPKEYIFVLGVLMLLIAVPALLKLAPVETPNKQLDEVEKKHHYRKMVSHLIILCVLVIALFTLELHSFALTICMGIMLSGSLLFLKSKVS